MYPAFRTTISEKHGTCNSIDTRSYDSDQVDLPKKGDTKLKPAIKNVQHEFDSMRRGLQRENLRKAQEAEEYRYEEARRQEHQRADRLGRTESNRGLGRSNRTRKPEMLLTDENIKHSLRQARDKGRTFDDKGSHRGSTRSSRTRNKSHSPSRSVDNYTRSYRADSDYNYSDYGSDHHRDRGRNRSRSVGSRPSQRSSSGTHSRRKRDYSNDRDAFSDYDDRRRRHRHDSRERYSEDEYRSRRDSSSYRPSTHRSRTNSTGRRNR